MDSPASPVADPSPPANRERALGIIATATVLALLYFARGVLVPITLAVILSLLIAPLVRVLRRLRLGQTVSVLAAVLVLALSFAAVAGVIGSQLMRMAQSLPRYERTIERKLKTLNDVTVGKFNALTDQAGRMMYRRTPVEEPEPVEKPPARQRSSARQHPSSVQHDTAQQSGTSQQPTSQQPSTLQQPGTPVPSASPSSVTPGRSGTSQPAEAPEPSGTSRRTQAPEPSDTSRQSDPPQQSDSSDASQLSDASQQSDASQPSGASQPSDTSQPSDASQPSETPQRPATLNQARRLRRSEPAASNGPIAVEVHEPPPNPLQIIEKVLGSIWVPIETAGIVLVVLVFVLLEHEALRDRFIRIAGGTDIRLTTLAINDAGERLSRFFVSQFAVNFGLGLTIWVGLTIIGLPHPLLWAALAGVLRFVPYIGVWIAALCAVLLAAAVDPHWTLALTTLGLFLVVELIAGQLVEPQLYGHTHGCRRFRWSLQRYSGAGCGDRSA